MRPQSAEGFAGLRIRCYCSFMLAFSFSNLGQCDFDFVEKLLPAAVAVFEELGR